MLLQGLFDPEIEAAQGAAPPQSAVRASKSLSLVSLFDVRIELAHRFAIPLGLGIDVVEIHADREVADAQVDVFLDLVRAVGMRTVAHAGRVAALDDVALDHLDIWV